MSDDTGNEGIQIDSDWKSEAAQEKQRLEAQESAADAQAPPPVGGFAEIVNVLAMQAIVALGGYQGPGGEQLPPNPATAKHFIDMLQTLSEKTKGNLTDDESKMMTAVLYEMRMQFVQTTNPPASDTSSPAGDPSPLA